MTKARLLQLERARRGSDVPELVSEIKRLCGIIKDQRKERDKLQREYETTWHALAYYAVPRRVEDKAIVEEAREKGRARFEHNPWKPSGL